MPYSEEEYGIKALFKDERYLKLQRDFLMFKATGNISSMTEVAKQSHELIKKYCIEVLDKDGAYTKLQQEFLMYKAINDIAGLAEVQKKIDKLIEDYNLEELLKEAGKNSPEYTNCPHCSCGNSIPSKGHDLDCPNYLDDAGCICCEGCTATNTKPGLHHIVGCPNYDNPNDNPNGDSEACSPDCTHTGNEPGPGHSIHCPNYRGPNPGNSKPSVKPSPKPDSKPSTNTKPVIKPKPNPQPKHDKSSSNTSGILINRTFSGADMVASIVFPGYKPFVIGELTTISYSIYREKSPVRTCGFINPRGYVKGGRTIAGTMVFTVFDKHIVNQLKKEIPYLAGIKKLKVDELPPFDIYITMGNEYGAEGRINIYGMTVVDEGQVMSVEDLFTENQWSYMARDIDELDDIGAEQNAPTTNFEADHDVGKFNINNLVMDNTYEAIMAELNAMKKSADDATKKAREQAAREYTTSGESFKKIPDYVFKPEYGPNTILVPPGVTPPNNKPGIPLTQVSIMDMYAIGAPSYTPTAADRVIYMRVMREQIIDLLPDVYYEEAIPITVELYMPLPGGKIKLLGIKKEVWSKDKLSVGKTGCAKFVIKNYYKVNFGNSRANHPYLRISIPSTFNTITVSGGLTKHKQKLEKPIIYVAALGAGSKTGSDSITFNYKHPSNVASNLKHKINLRIASDSVSKINTLTNQVLSINKQAEWSKSSISIYQYYDKYTSDYADKPTSHGGDNGPNWTKGFYVGANGQTSFLATHAVPKVYFSAAHDVKDSRDLKHIYIKGHVRFEMLYKGTWYSVGGEDFNKNSFKTLTKRQIDILQSSAKSFRIPLSQCCGKPPNGFNVGSSFPGDPFGLCIGENGVDSPFKLAFQLLLEKYRGKIKGVTRDNVQKRNMRVTISNFYAVSNKTKPSDDTKDMPVAGFSCSTKQLTINYAPFDTNSIKYLRGRQ